MKAVIMAAGRGERLRPLTATRPKQLLPVGGKPQLEWLLRDVARAGVKEVLLITNYMEESIKSAFSDGSSLDLKLSYKTQNETKGTADAFGYAEKFVEGSEFLGLNGDLYLAPGTVKSVLKTHQIGTMTLTGIEKDPYLYSAFRLEGKHVLGVVEKPKPGKAPSNITNAGIYIFPPEIFEAIHSTRKSPRGEYEITDTINSLISGGLDARLHLLGQEDWLDIGHPWTLLEANSRALSRMNRSVEGKVEEGAHLSGVVHVDSTARIRSGAYIEGPVFVGPDSDIGPNCYIRPGTAFVGGNRVGAACEVKNSILMEDAAVPHLSYVGDSIIGARCNLGAGTITANLRFDHANVLMTIRDEREDTGLRKFGSVFGDDAQTGINVCLHPGVKVGVGAWIAPGVTVERDVPDMSLLTHSGLRPRPGTH